MSAKRTCVEKDRQTFNDGDKDQKLEINSLDYDSLAKIFMLLPIPERIDMEEVCVKWKDACQRAWYDIKKYKCESSIGRCYHNRLLTQSYLEEILLRCGNYLRQLSLSNICNSSIMPFVGEHCKNLTSLECEFNDDSLIHNADHFVQAFTQLDKLKCIKIKVNCQYDEKTIDLFAIINSLPEEINGIHLFSWLKRNRTVSMTLQKFKNLQQFTVHGLCLENILHEIAEKTTLVHLSIQLYDIHIGLSLFNKLANLEYIDLTSGTTGSIHANNISTKVLNTIFCTCKNLKHLDIPYGLTYNVAEIPHKKWINFHNLQYLSMSCTIMPDLANTIVQYCKNLKDLRIHHPYHYMSDAALKKLTELVNLECLILLGCIKLSKESIIVISNNCKKLKRLEVPGCFIVPFAFLDEFSKLQYLEHLNLFGTLNLKSSAITAIANNCKNLKILQIQDCNVITEAALVAITKLENLQKLDISFIDIITDSFLIKLKGLKELHCNGCKKLTKVGIIELIKNNPDLDMIDVRLIGKIKIDFVIDADQVTKSRTNGIILHIKISNPSIIQASKSIIKSQWLVVEDI